MSNGVLFLYSILAQTFPESPDVRMVSYVFISNYEFVSFYWKI